MDNQQYGIEGRVCLVTGGSRGIGAAIVRKVAQAGALVAVNYYSSENRALELVSSIKNSGGNAIAVQADIGKEDEVQQMFSVIEKQLGKVDILINNAGTSLRALVTDTSESEWDKVINTNLKGAFFCCRRAVPHMISQRYGRIVNIASIWGITGASYESVYAASKGGLIILSKSLARELGPSGITVNAVAPGPIETEMLKSELDEKELAELADDIPAGRLGSPEDVADACLYLVSSGASFINGQVITVDGGWV